MKDLIGRPRDDDDEHITARLRSLGDHLVRIGSDRHRIGGSASDWKTNEKSDRHRLSAWLCQGNGSDVSVLNRREDKAVILFITLAC